MKKSVLFKKDVHNIRIEIIDSIVEYMEKTDTVMVKLNRPIFLETDDYPVALYDYINSDSVNIECIVKDGWMSSKTDVPNQVIPFQTLTTDILIKLLVEVEQLPFGVEEIA